MMKSAILFFITLFWFYSSFGQKRNTEIGAGLFSVNSYVSGVEKGKYQYKFRIISVFNADGKFYNPFYEKEELTSSSFSTPQFFIRKRIINNGWLKATIEYNKIKIDSHDTFYESWGTSSTTYDNYHFQQNGIAFSLTPQYQWMNKKALYINSGLGTSMTFQKTKLEQSGTSYGCFGGGAFNERKDQTKLFFESVFLTNSIGIMLYKDFNAGYDLQTGIHIQNGHQIFINRFWISKTL